MRKLVLAAAFSLAVSANAKASNTNSEGFQKLSDKGPLTDKACIRAGGTPMNYDEKLWRQGKFVGKMLYTNDGIYVVYAAVDPIKSLVVPTYTIMHCKFPH